MSQFLPFFALLLAAAIVAWYRGPFVLWSALAALLLIIFGLLGIHFIAVASAALILGLMSALILLPFLRKPFISAPLLKLVRKILPPLSQTERITLETGSVGFEGELFSGKPNWDVLFNYPKPQLSAEEHAFLDGPVETLCQMINDWEITHIYADLPPQLWDFIRQERFFGMIIPKKYGGLGFSALAHHKVIQKIASISSVVSSTVGVPNSLGPGELLLHYGTEEQKNYYLPRLARGEEIPCFALTGPFSGSDATSIPDYGIVCNGQWQGEEVLGLRLTFDKRYITLAPVASLIGLAFRMYDPEKLLGETEDIGITLALLPRDIKGLDIGRRHFPLNTPFQNGPIRGHEVFIPLKQIIGGPEKRGQGWAMLNQCLAIGRSITLPSTAAGGAGFAAVVGGSYARIRKQFGLSIGRFEGVEAALARIGGKAYKISALAQATAAAVDRGDIPAVPSTIAKYHCTTLSREVASDFMDIIGGKGIILGPRNIGGRYWQATPIAITVEGANIMTRSLLIFGQGAILSHPFLLKEMRAASHPDHKTGLNDFDQHVFAHMRHVLSNMLHSLGFGLTFSLLGKASGDKHTQRYFRKLNRYAANLALLTDVSMLVLGGKLKFKESLSGRLADVLSHLYMSAFILKRYHDEGVPAAQRPLLAWAFHDSIHQIEKALSAALRNFPVRWLGWLLWGLIFPFGRRAHAPGDRLNRRVAAILTAPGEARDYLAQGLFLTPGPNNPGGRIASYLSLAVVAEPIERKFLKFIKNCNAQTLDFSQQLDLALTENIIDAEQRRLLEQLHALTLDTITVDDFTNDELKAGKS